MGLSSDLLPGLGPLVWKNTAQSALSSADTNAWIESRMPSYPTAAVEKGMAKVIG